MGMVENGENGSRGLDGTSAKIWIGFLYNTSDAMSERANRDLFELHILALLLDYRPTLTRAH